MGEVGFFGRAPHAQNTPHPDLLRSYSLNLMFFLNLSGQLAAASLDVNPTAQADAAWNAVAP
jgi:hypothetical protein